jgi:uncharacterized protein (TIGR02246 family)
MKRLQVSPKKMLLIAAATIAIIYYICTRYISTSSLTEQNISKLTDKWCEAVTINNDPQEIANLFCKDGNLVGTVSQVKRTGNDIKSYFDYFAKLPKIQTINRDYNITKVTNDVFINTAFITWQWKGLQEPIVARMTFVYRNKCIFQLHSSALPELNKDLLNISNVA